MEVDGIGDVAAVLEGVRAVDSIAEAACELVVAFSGLRCQLSCRGDRGHENKLSTLCLS